MRLPSTVARVVFMAMVVFLQCGVVRQAKIVYLVCFMKRAPLLHQYTGFIEIGCWHTKCIVDFVERHNTTTVSVEPYTFRRIPTVVINPNVTGWYDIYSMSLITTSNLTVMCGSSHFPFFDDVFTLYPVLESDKTFVVALSKFIQFAVLLSVERFTDVTIAYSPAPPKTYPVMLVKFKMYPFVAYYWRDRHNVKKGTTAVIEASERVAVYCGGDEIQASVRPMTSNGRTFMVGGIGGRLADYTMAVTSPIHQNTTVIWVRENGGWTTQTIVPPEEDLPGVLQASVRFKTLYIEAEKPVAVALTFQGARTGYSDMTSLVFLTPDTRLTSKSCYALCVPYDTPGRLRGTRMLSFISMATDVHKILANGVKVRRWFASGLFPVNSSALFYAATIEHNQTMTFWVDPSYDSSSVLFSLYLFGHSLAGVYHSEAMGIPDGKGQLFDQSTKAPIVPSPSDTTETEVTVKPVSCCRDEDYDSPQQWLLFGVAMPFSLVLSLTVFYLLAGRRKLKVRHDESTLAEDFGEADFGEELMKIEGEAIPVIAPTPAAGRQSTTIH